jgi:hypothetical protein
LDTTHVILPKMCAKAKASLRRRTSCVHKDCGHGRRSSRALTELQRRAADSPITLTPLTHIPQVPSKGTNKTRFAKTRFN